MSVTITTYQPEHFDGVKSLWEASFPDDPPRNSAEISIAAKVNVHPELFLVALEKTRIVGTVMAGYDGHRGWLYRVAVTHPRRHQGIGAALIREAEARLWALGCVKINLQVTGSNAKVVGFYQRLGYAIEDRVSLGKLPRRLT
jgi:ribosomal protein S18 acetylase RimI-like enzyme